MPPTLLFGSCENHDLAGPILSDPVNVSTKVRVTLRLFWLHNSEERPVVPQSHCLQIETSTPSVEVRSLATPRAPSQSRMNESRQKLKLVGVKWRKALYAAVTRIRPHFAGRDFWWITISMSRHCSDKRYFGMRDNCSRIGCSRETVSRALSNLKRKGVAELVGTTLRVHGRSAVQTLADI